MQDMSTFKERIRTLEEEKEQLAVTRDAVRKVEEEKQKIENEKRILEKTLVRKLIIITCQRS